MLRLSKYKYAFFLSLLSLATLILSSSFFLSFNLDIDIRHYRLVRSGTDHHIQRQQSMAMIHKEVRRSRPDQVALFVRSSTASTTDHHEQLQALRLHENVEKVEEKYRLHNIEANSNQSQSINYNMNDTCGGRRIYMYNLPAEFNALILQECHNKIAYWINFCSYFINHGFGKAVNQTSADWVQDWYETDPYMLEVIFHSRMTLYPCRTQAPDEADAFFIPYYTGLDALHYLYGEKRAHGHEHGVKLVRWLMERSGKHWRGRGGHDHFIVMGRTAWDFTRVPLSSRRKSTVQKTEGEPWNLSNNMIGADHVEEGWGTSFASLPAMENVTALFLERRPWRRLEQAIPYPTGFHPTSLQSLRAWQDKVLAAKRAFLFAFVGAPRPPESSSPEQRRIRQAAIDECAGNTTACSLLDCSKMDCVHDPVYIAAHLLGADFCLQPPGDTATRRSTFDGLLSGCIPVFFSNDSAYSQYTWHLPPDKLNPSSYSVLVPGAQLRRRVLPLLSSLSREHVARMRTVIVEHLIPRLIYNSPHLAASNPALRDAFQLALEGMLRRVAQMNA